MKICIKCRVEKDLTEFYAHKNMGDGHLNKCKTCSREDVKANRDARRDYYLEYDRNRPNKAERCQKAMEYQQTEKGKEVRKKAGKAYTARYPLPPPPTRAGASERSKP